MTSDAWLLSGEVAFVLVVLALLQWHSRRSFNRRFAMEEARKNAALGAFLNGLVEDDCEEWKS